MLSLFKSNTKADSPVGRLAILVPTFRTDALARHVLAGVASLASDNVAVILADNSENREKQEYLRKLQQLHPNIHVYCHARNIGALRNWQFLFDRSDLPYYQVVGDDDLFAPEIIADGVRLLDDRPDVSAVGGAFLMLTSDRRLVTGNGTRNESTAAQRCVNFRIGGGNSVPNSMARRSAVEPFLIYLRDHPLRASFFDWLMSFTLLASGRYQTLERGFYLYDLTNWETPQACWRSNANYYMRAGLPESFTIFHELYWGIETVHFFLGAYSPVSDHAQRESCARYFYSDRVAEFRRVYAMNGAAIDAMLNGHPHAGVSMRRLIANEDAMEPQIFDWFADVLTAVNPDCGVAYLDYVRSSLLRVEQSPLAKR